MHWSDLDREIDNLAAMVRRAQPTPDEWKLVRTIGAAFKEASYPAPSDKQAAYDQFRVLADSASERRQILFDSQREAAAELVGRIKQLAERYGEDSRENNAWVSSELKEIHAQFKSTRFPTPEDRKNAWEIFGRAQGSIKSLREQRRAEHQRQSDLLRDQISTLTANFREAQVGKHDWPSLWVEVRQVRQAFRETRFPDRDTRQRLRDQFDALASEMENDRARHKYKQEIRASVSSDIGSEILGWAHNAIPRDRAMEEMFLNAAAATMAPALFLDGGFIRLDNKKRKLVECSESMKRAWTIFSEKKGDLTRADKDEIFPKLQDAQDRLNVAWAEWKEENDEHHTRRRAEREEKQSAWRARTEANIEKNRERLSRLTERYENSEAYLDRIREERDTAWSDNFRDRMDSKIDEVEAQQSELRSKISDVEGYITEDEEKLRR